MREKMTQVVTGGKIVNANYSLRAMFDGTLIDHSASYNVNKNWCDSFSNFYMTMKLCSKFSLDFLKAELRGFCIFIA